jgi:hypothetical protein
MKKPAAMTATALEILALRTRLRETEAATNRPRVTFEEGALSLQSL